MSIRGRGRQHHQRRALGLGSWWRCRFTPRARGRATIGARAYTYNAAGRLKTVSYEGNLKGTYTYNGLEQLITRTITNSGTLDGTIHTVHDRSGNVIAEVDASGQTVREYLWLPEGGYAETDLPLAVVDGVNTAFGNSSLRFSPEARRG